MKKSEKSGVIGKIHECFLDSVAVFLVNQNRMTVGETEDLRKRLRGIDSCYLVSKNTLARLAVKDTAFECILPHLRGQTAIVFSNDITGSAKVISEYASSSDDKIVVVCGGYNGRLLDVDDVNTLARLPTMDELRAKIIAVVQTPAGRIARLLQAPACQIVRVLKNYSEK